MREVTISERQFVINNLDPKRAFHVVRRIAPLVGALPFFAPYLLGERRLDPNDLEEIAVVMAPLAKNLAEMPEEDANYVIDVCLSVVQLRMPDGRGLAPIQAPGGYLMYDWINMPMMVRLVFETITENLTGFMPAGAPAS